LRKTLCSPKNNKASFAIEGALRYPTNEDLLVNNMIVNPFLNVKSNRNMFNLTKKRLKRSLLGIRIQSYNNINEMKRG